MKKWSITATHTFFNELLNLPPSVSKKFTRSIKALENNPIEANGDIKKLRHQVNLYRLRIGDYRLIYTFGEGWVKLLAVGNRGTIYDDEITETSLPEASSTSQRLQTQEINPETSFKVIPEQHQVSNTEEQTIIRELPFKLTQNLLKQWQIPSEYWVSIMNVRNEEELLQLPLSNKILTRILDNLYPRPLEELATQPEYIISNVEDLDRFFEGDLQDFLLKLDPQQEKLVNFGDGGPVLVKGGPGTGKSTLALYRVKRLIEQGYTNILFTTYTNALINYSEQLLTQLLGCPPEDAGVKVSTVDALVYNYYKQHYNSPSFASNQECLTLLKIALEKTQINSRNIFEQRVSQVFIERLGLSYLLEEILEVIENWGLDSLQAYLTHERKGRGTKIRSSIREAIWAIYQTWLVLMEDQEKTTWELLRHQSLKITQELTSYPYQALIIDEAQDLSPTSLRFLLNLVPNFNAVYLTADASQSLYQRGFSWKQIHQDLKVAGRTIVLKHNYRNTQQIAKACACILKDSTGGDQECLEQTTSLTQSEQPLLLLLDDSEREVYYIKEFFLQAARKFGLPLHGGAVLCLSSYHGRDYALKLTQVGLNAKFVLSKEIDLKAPYIKVLTLHSAKGLEFPFVVLPGLKEGQFPNIHKNIPEEEINTLLEEQLRLLYVGCSRAMRALMVCGSFLKPSQFLTVFHDSYWQKQEYPQVTNFN